MERQGAGAGALHEVGLIGGNRHISLPPVYGLVFTDNGLIPGRHAVDRRVVHILYGVQERPGKAHLRKLVIHQRNDFLRLNLLPRVLVAENVHLVHHIHKVLDVRLRRKTGI